MTPDEFTIQETFVEVGDGHTLYVHEWGSSKAKLPVLFVHGGPGGGCKDRHKQGFDPKLQRVIFFDQRGSGKSVPYGSLEHNTTKELVEDIEKIAKHLKLEQFVFSGSSWGVCLALAYALKYPKRIRAMVLAGIFTGSQAEIDWLDKGGFRDFFPEVWQRYLDATPKAHHADPSAYHYKCALGKDEQGAKQSAYAHNNLEGGIMSLDDRFTPENFDDFDSTSTRIEMHYLGNRCFLPDRHLLDNAHKLTMPVWLVQGRYDFDCPPKTAYELHQKLPNSQLVWTVSNHKAERELWNVMRTILLQLAGDT
jgi:proline iminopeptidase